MSAEVFRPDRFPPAAAARVCAELLNRHSPHEIASAIEVLIDLQNLMEGDPDAETEGLEDDFTPTREGVDYGPGCPLADPAEVDDEAEEDDPSGQCDEDGVNTAFEGLRSHAGPGCPIGDGLEQLK